MAPATTRPVTMMTVMRTIAASGGRFRHSHTRGGYAPPSCASPCGAQGGGYARGYYGGSGYYMAGPTVTTIVIQSGATTTTTVTEEVIEEVEEVRTYRAPVKTVRRYPSKTVRRSTKDCCR